MPSTRRLCRFLSTVLPALGAPLLVGCGAEQGAIVSALSTDLAVPKDVDRTRLEIETDERVELAAEYPSPGTELQLPGTRGGVSCPDGEGCRPAIRAPAAPPSSPRT
ncbi:hypothetical protein [Chondromyces apiculatus]|nr:hypothetical protein [Chondromyces apiculatus]